MKKRRFKRFRITLKGMTWSYGIVSKQAYETKHGKESLAITLAETANVEFKPTAVKLSVVRHELLHMYCGALHLNSADLTGSQMEEVIAELLEEKWDEYDKNAHKIYNRMKEDLDNAGPGKEVRHRKTTAIPTTENRIRTDCQSDGNGGE